MTEKQMWKWGAIGIVFIVLVFMMGGCFQMIKPGTVGVVVDMFGDDKGVEAKERGVGMHFIPPWKKLYEFPVFEQNHTWENNDAFSFQTSEGLAVSADIGITFHLDHARVPLIFSKYRRGMAEITDVFVRNNVRDAINTAASKMKIEDLYGVGKEAFFDEVQRHVRQDLQPIGIELGRIYLIGRFHFPENVVTALNQKIEATQRAQQRENELREAEAEAKKQVAKSQGVAQCAILEAQSRATSSLIEAEAAAKGNHLMSSSLTPELVAWQYANKWDGVLPSVISEGSVVPFMTSLQRDIH